MKNENKTFILSSFLTSQTLNYWELLFCVFVIKNLFYSDIIIFPNMPLTQHPS